MARDRRVFTTEYKQEAVRLLLSFAEQMETAMDVRFSVTRWVLLRLGFEPDPHVWECLGHPVFFDPELPQSREMHGVARSEA